jgi:SAM-dependent methyltransferase
MLLRVAEEHGIEIDGIELTPARRDLAREQTSAQIFERPLEDLRLPDASYAAVFMVNVFSHLFSPSATFAEIHRILVPGGILVIWTSEIGSGVKPHHTWDWGLGDHCNYWGMRRSSAMRTASASSWSSASGPGYPTCSTPGSDSRRLAHREPGTR